MRAADVPLLALAVRCQNERALARANQHPYLAHVSPLFRVSRPLFHGQIGSRCHPSQPSTPRALHYIVDRAWSRSTFPTKKCASAPLIAGRDSTVFCSNRHHTPGRGVNSAKLGGLSIEDWPAAEKLGYRIRASL